MGEFSEGFAFTLVRVHEDGSDEILQIRSPEDGEDGLNFYETVAAIEALLNKFGFRNNMDDYVKSKYV